MKALIVVALAALTAIAAEVQAPSSAKLAVAIKSGQRAAALDMIAKKSADVNAAEADGSTPLMIVARTANVAAAKLLLDKGANPNVKEAQREQTPLMWAAAASQGAMMRELLAHGAE